MFVSAKELSKQRNVCLGTAYRMCRSITLNAHKMHGRWNIPQKSIDDLTLQEHENIQRILQRGCRIIPKPLGGKRVTLATKYKGKYIYFACDSCKKLIPQYTLHKEN